MILRERQTDALVVGAGPAGLCLAYELLQRGIETICIAPELAPWAPNYGAWVDELIGLDVPVEHQWSRARVSFPRHETVDLERAYAKIDSSALYRRWSAAVQASDRFMSGVVASALFSGDFHQIQLRSGESIRARQVFDASGHEPKIARRGPTSPAYQTAFGARIPRQEDTMGSDTMGLMLWDNGLGSGSPEVAVPAFYYEMPVDAESSFVEYTVLADRPFIPVETIEARFRRDHDSLCASMTDLERCFIPMGHSIPPRDQPVVAFGGAASMVHPATGYMVARTLRDAPVLADAYVALRGATGDERARGLWQTIWPDDRVRAHELYRFGLEALLTLDVEETHAFFSAFFALPDELWRSYQSGVAEPRQIAATMWAVFRAAPAGLRLKLARAGFGPHRDKLTRLLR